MIGEKINLLLSHASAFVRSIAQSWLSCLLATATKAQMRRIRVDLFMVTPKGAMTKQATTRPASHDAVG
jgi:hypothetical protein